MQRKPWRQTPDTMLISIFVLSVVLIAFLCVVGYLLYLKKNNRSMDEEDCVLGKKKAILSEMRRMKKKERKQALKKKRELEQLDRRHSKKGI